MYGGKHFIEFLDYMPSHNITPTIASLLSVAAHKKTSKKQEKLTFNILQGDSKTNEVEFRETIFSFSSQIISLSQGSNEGGKITTFTEVRLT